MAWQLSFSDEKCTRGVCDTRHTIQLLSYLYLTFNEHPSIDFLGNQQQNVSMFPSVKVTPYYLTLLVVCFHALQTNYICARTYCMHYFIAVKWIITKVSEVWLNDVAPGSTGPLHWHSALLHTSTNISWHLFFFDISAIFSLWQIFQKKSKKQKSYERNVPTKDILHMQSMFIYT